MYKKFVLHGILEITYILLDYTSNDYNTIPFLFCTKLNYHSLTVSTVS